VVAFFRNDLALLSQSFNCLVRHRQEAIHGLAKRLFDVVRVFIEFSHLPLLRDVFGLNTSNRNRDCFDSVKSRVVVLPK